jgi:epoxyqueuosine reductase
MAPTGEGVSGALSREPLSSVWLTSTAREVGFHLVGFARAEPIPAAVLVDWLEAGFAADLDWMKERVAEKLDVGVLFPGAKTVVAFACNYYSEGSSSIARYARGRDYHYTLKDQLRAFRRHLKAKFPDVGTYGSVDHGPVMEKVWAARAGLGYVGKNGCLISPKYGSYLLLAALILDTEVDAYAEGPTPDLCGKCSLCIDACPTGALLEGKRVDAGKCLSYQTIENEGQVPEALRAAFEDITFGCDLCQDACPLNDQPVRTEHPRFAPRPVGELGVRELAGLSKEEFKTLTSGTPLGRAGYDGMRRNAAYALGASRDAGARTLLERLSSDSSPVVREAAAWALGRI